MRRFTSRIWHRLPEQLAPGGDHFPRALNHIRDLETKACPRPVSLTSAVDADQRSGDLQLAHDIALPDDSRPKRAAIKIHRPQRVCGPDDVLGAFHIHGSLRKRQIAATRPGKLVMHSEKRLDFGMHYPLAHSIDQARDGVVLYSLEVGIFPSLENPLGLCVNEPPAGRRRMMSAAPWFRRQPGAERLLIPAKSNIDRFPCAHGAARPLPKRGRSGGPRRSRAGHLPSDRSGTARLPYRLQPLSPSEARPQIEGSRRLSRRIRK
jgi:hypothetical protein